MPPAATDIPQKNTHTTVTNTTATDTASDIGTAALTNVAITNVAVLVVANVDLPLLMYHCKCAIVNVLLLLHWF